MVKPIFDPNRSARKAIAVLEAAQAQIARSGPRGDILANVHLAAGELSLALPEIGASHLSPALDSLRSASPEDLPTALEFVLALLARHEAPGGR